MDGGFYLLLLIIETILQKGIVLLLCDLTLRSPAFSHPWIVRIGRRASSKPKINASSKPKINEKKHHDFLYFSKVQYCCISTPPPELATPEKVSCESIFNIVLGSKQIMSSSHIQNRKSKNSDLVHSGFGSSDHKKQREATFIERMLLLPLLTMLDRVAHKSGQTDRGKAPARRSRERNPSRVVLQALLQTYSRVVEEMGGSLHDKTII
jgi:hypothetical protein